MISRKEYARLRDIAEKRSKRLEAAGLPGAQHFPTTRSIKTEIDLLQNQLEIQAFLADPGSTVKGARIAEGSPAGETRQERQRRQSRERSRRYREREREWKRGLSANEQKLLKNIEKWGGSVNRNNWQKWLDYLAYRHSQQKGSKKYEFDKYVQEFTQLKEAGQDLSISALKDDFEAFTAQQQIVREELEKSNPNFSASAVSLAWSKFAKRG